MGNLMDEQPKFMSEYFDSLKEHIAFTQEAGRQLGVSETQLLVHDASKLDPIEWFAYAMHFKGVGAPRRFEVAWLHHIHKNPHHWQHWQHWMFPDNYTQKGGRGESGVLPMPREYVLEMVADWMGSSMAYTGSWDMTEWLDKNLKRVRLHSTSSAFLNKTLAGLGYVHKHTSQAVSAPAPVAQSTDEG